MEISFRRQEVKEMGKRRPRAEDEKELVVRRLERSALGLHC